MNVKILLIVLWVVIAVFGIGLIIAWARFFKYDQPVLDKYAEEQVKKKKEERLQERIRKRKEYEEKRERERQKEAERLAMVEVVKKLTPIDKELVEAVENCPLKNRFYIGHILYDELLADHILNAMKNCPKDCIESKLYKKHVREITNSIKKIKSKNDELFIRTYNMCIKCHQKIFLPRAVTSDFILLTNGDLVKIAGVGAEEGVVAGFMHDYYSVFIKEIIEEPVNNRGGKYKWHFVGCTKQ